MTLDKNPSTGMARIIQEDQYYAFGYKLGGLSYDNSSGNKYLFNGKELQPELDMYDFGARFYDPLMARWHSVDPRAHKYYNLSPYVALGNNPVKFVDPDGKEIWISFDVVNQDRSITQQKVQYKDGKLYDANGKAYVGGNDYVTKVQNDLNQLSSDDSDLRDRVCTLQESKNLHTIEMVMDPRSGNSHTSLDYGKSNRGIPVGSNVEYDPNATESVEGDIREPRVGLAHELLGHSYDTDQGITKKGTTENGIPLKEVDAVNIENKARLATGNPQRTSYGGREIPKELLNSPFK